MSIAMKIYLAFIVLATSLSVSALPFPLGGFSAFTENGLILGHRAINRSAVAEYLGIPFAQAPVGALRFASPQKYHSSGLSRPFIASKFGDDCPQTASKPINYPNKTSQFQNIISSFGNVVGNPQSEDCLSLNIWSKSRFFSSKNPVLVYFYGGRWAIGASHSNFYDGQYLADAQDVVVVTINFRINIFGYPGAPDQSQNLGLQDQRLAVEWIRDNIAAFNGDPARITIFGQSSGSVAADYWAYAYPEDPIVAGLISHSGDVFSFPINTPELAAKNWYNASAMLGCGSSGDVMHCMRNKNFTDIRSVATQVLPPPSSSQARSQPAFQPTDDSITVFSDYWSRSANGQFAKIPYLLGNNDNEAGYYKIPAYAQGKVLNDSVWHDFNQEDFTCAVSLEAANRVKNGVPTWRFRYFGDWENLHLYPGSGAYHGSDVEMVFGADQDVSGIAPSVPEQLSTTIMQKAWVTFAKDPKDGLEKLLGWPRYNPNTSSLILLAFNNLPWPAFGNPAVYESDCNRYLSVYQSV